MSKAIQDIKNDPHYYILLLIGLSGVGMSFAFGGSPLAEIGDWLAVSSGTWLIARAYYTP